MPQKRRNAVESDVFYAFVEAIWADKNLAQKMLAETPALIDARSGLGETALHWFAVEDCRDEIEWLLARGADINPQNKFGATPLMEAVQLGYAELIAFLLENGADPRIEYRGETALSEAIERGDEAIVRMLRKKLWELGAPPAKPPPAPDETARYEAWQRAAGKNRKKRSR